MSDQTIIPIFFIDAVRLGFRSEQEGREIHEDREFIRILIAGDQKSEVVREVTDADRQRFAEAYKKFKAGLNEDEQLVGTRLRDWTAMTPATIRDFNSLNIFTVEQIANLSDVAVSNFGMGGLEWRAKAKAYLDLAKDSAAAGLYAAENERLKADIADLQQQIRDLASQVTEERRGPGRPRKDAA